MNKPNATQTARRQISEQRQEIERRRAERKPSEVDLHHIPNWLRLRIIRATKGQRSPAYCVRGHQVLDWALSQLDSHSWLDHWGSATVDGEPCFVAEPYLNPNDLPSAEAFAAAYGLTLEVSDNSWWYPGSTTRLTFRPCTESQRSLFPKPAETQSERCRRILAEAEARGAKWRRPSKRRKASPERHSERLTVRVYTICGISLPRATGR